MLTFAHPHISHSQIKKPINMKRFLSLSLSILLLAAFTAPVTTLTKKERKFARDILKETRKDLVKTVSRLSDAQLKFKPAPDRWSVEQCVMHIAKAEQMLWEYAENGMKQPANPEKRSEIKYTDEQWIKGVEDRSNKFKAPEPIQPQNSGFANMQEALTAFKASREKIINYISTTQEDLRNHVLVLPVGTLDAYQMSLFISAHSNRHTQQIKEVMADANFPKQ